MTSEADLVVGWRHEVVALEHPRLGFIGPLAPPANGQPQGAHGMTYVSTSGLEPSDRGVRSAFDMVPTLPTLLGQKRAHWLGEQKLSCKDQEPLGESCVHGDGGDP